MAASSVDRRLRGVDAVGRAGGGRPDARSQRRRPAPLREGGADGRRQEYFYGDRTHTSPRARSFDGPGGGRPAARVAGQFRSGRTSHDVLGRGRGLSRRARNGRSGGAATSREAPHATMMVYPTAELARQRVRDASPWFRSLNVSGSSTTPQPAPAGGVRAALSDAASWPDIRVPTTGNAGPRHSDLQQFRDTRSPYDARNPRAQRNDNPVGSTRTAFGCRREWAGRRVLLHFPGRFGVLSLGLTASGSGTTRTAGRPPSSTSRARPEGTEPAGRRGVPLERRVVLEDQTCSAERHLPDVYLWARRSVKSEISSTAGIRSGPA